MSELVHGGFDRPVHVCAPAGDAERLFVVEQSGTVRVLENGVLQPVPFLDVTEELTYFGENGLLALAFHPGYFENGYVFVTYTDLQNDIRLVRYTVDDPEEGDAVNPASAVILLDLDKPFVQHNGGALAFGPFDGYLYLSIGDGGSGNDPLGNGQNLGTLLGKVLRLDVDQAPYAVPPDNPFVGRPGARPEIWAYGLRNPWRMGFDALTGALLVGDVGQQAREEVNRIAPGSSGGENFGWRCSEGTLCTGACPCPALGLKNPLHEYDHNVGCAIVGGFVYRGSAVPALHGRYLFADYCTSRVWSLAFDGDAASDLLEHTTELSPPAGDLGLISSFGQDGLGEAYIVSHVTGQVRKIVVAGVLDCDGDGTPDADELAQGTAFDANFNSVPDVCEALLTVTNLVPGQTTWFWYVGAEPGAPVFFFYSTRGIGPGPCFFGGNLCLDLLQMQVAGVPMVPLMFTLSASAQGEVLFGIPVTGPIVGIAQLGFQTVTLTGGVPVKSNAVLKVP